MATSPSSTRRPPELSTDFEQWFAGKAKSALCIESNASDIPVACGESNVTNEQFRATLDKTAPAFEFKLFPILPKEMRLKIWDFGALHPRVIHLHRDPEAESTLICRQPAPGILQACHESRTVALPYFEVLFDPNSSFPGADVQKIYVQPEIDTYYIGDFNAIHDAEEDMVTNMDRLHNNCLHPIKRLAMEYNLFMQLIIDNNWQRGPTGRETLMKFRDLKTLVIAIELDKLGHEYTWHGTLIPGFRRKIGKHIELVSTINPAIAAEDPSDPQRFITNRLIDCKLEQHFGCSSDERPWKLQGLLDHARETMRDMWLINRAWKIPQVEICVVVRSPEER